MKWPASKRHEFGIVIDPVTVTPLMKVRDAIALQRQHGISGLPVVEGGKLVGIVTNRDLRFEENLDQPLRDIMTPQDRLVTMKGRRHAGRSPGPDAQASPGAC